MATRGWADERIKAVVDRSQELLDLVEDSPQTVPTLWALWLFHYTRCHHEQAWALSRRLVSMAEQRGDTGLKLMALCALGNSALTEDRLAETQGYFEQVFTLYDPEQHAKLAAPFGFDGRAYAAMCLVLVKWLQGYGDQAKDMVQKGLRWAEESKHPGSQGFMYVYQLTFLYERGEREQILAVAETAQEFGRRYFLTNHVFYFQMFRAWAARDVETLRKLLAIPDAMGQDLGKTYYKGLLLDLELEAGHYDVTLDLAENLIRWGRASQETYMISNLLRIKGLCLRARGEHPAAEASLREAVDVARHQNAKLLELRAAVELCELLQERGRGAEARHLLAPLLQWFTEGFDVPVFLRAQALLRELPA
jgi:hypothetical protein